MRGVEKIPESPPREIIQKRIVSHKMAESLGWV
jgi:hypothetical protein